MPEEPEGKLISLLDEEGNAHEFEHLATVEYAGASYVALMPVYDKPEDLLESDAELVILKIIEDEDSGEEMLAAVEDDDEFDAVSEEFEKILGEDYDIVVSEEPENP
ncbi:DUF1292 domain-containing protein [Ethanoligenens sp.]|uniref:DUF1292 domain-containing protein n=1 Tax=Ethanoligenens sp. TaxID=2099655 RepID=UPI0039EC9F03